MPTPHIQAQPGDFAETLLMPGDPLRAKMLAENYLSDVVQVNTVRNMLGFTGTYQGQRISVMGSGMGIPSLSIYAHELFSQFGVERIVRVGSCGAVQPHVKVRDIILGMGASTDSVANRKRLGGFDFAAIADYRLLERLVRHADAVAQDVHVGNIFSADLFYEPDPELFQRMQKMGILAVEMEAAGLYGVAAELGKQALTVLTVSDHILTGEKLTAHERQEDFHVMLRLTLDALCDSGRS
ncbi:purine-nucleoside phosphorylase [Pseudomonas stutzeri]|jgi:purine-nucleoside phosphorylase|uniref:Purine nucleoside phosphorylase DeoD-type n=1 Tax=Stutzerimonas kunmingensis TaxID=1211807 RepID=A0A9X1N2B7_9GAMM|nr:MULTISPECIES: purine-nucleoside phosphorylase [Stutzerimonas]MBA4689707.1 purine-nucleoside phosphorylase [Pseudomonas sp.]MCD1607452.1 purine-nucleoside phosphorylase [Stutzerimonas kunmingensis]MCF0014979.1 purine-nucleoside phosphorylase [Stutzerimonas stutzeri]MCF0020398.1 purine-nucleoside phosphorylase [Stutzerimonas stutzeri]MDH0102105.1 purine-nucleoside phosphorylase [Stutzerimonas stutzeri]